jgi:hypothetical protein
MTRMQEIIDSFRLKIEPSPRARRAVARARRELGKGAGADEVMARAQEIITTPRRKASETGGNP